MNQIAQRVKNGAEQMGIALDETAAERFARYYELLKIGNEKMNLTAVLEPDEAVDRHFLDSIAPLGLHLLPEDAFTLDMGTGAGFPGVPLLIARPNLKITLADSMVKRLDFIYDTLEELGLKAEIIHIRAEEFGKLPAYRELYDVALARAVASLSPLMEYLLPCVRCGGQAICWKGPGVEQEAMKAKNAVFILGGKQNKIIPYSIPNRDWQHNLYVVDKVRTTPKAYPRRAGTPSKNPL